MKKKLLFVAAARPNFMKVGPILNLIKTHSDFESYLVHTGQHYDKNMSDTFFKQLNIPEPDIHLNVGSGSVSEQIAKTMIAFEKVYLEIKPDLVIVVGDVNATTACAIVTKQCHGKVAHIESGLRSFDRHMPEEINRILTDSISDIFYVTCIEAKDQLLSEGVKEEAICFVGNIMIDTLYNNLEKAKQTNFYSTLGLTEKDYILLTMHRPSNVDNDSLFSNYINTFIEISNKNSIVYPVHPRALAKLKELNLYSKLKKQPNFHLIDPIGYIEMLNLSSNSKAVFTDSGGLQEETTVLGVPCFTLRDNTERPITITQGSNTLVGSNPNLIPNHLNNLDSNLSKSFSCPEFWDGLTSQRILDDLLTRFLSSVTKEVQLV